MKLKHRAALELDILDALEYKSGNDSCNSVYVGSLGTAIVVEILGGYYGKSYIPALLNVATEAQVRAAHKQLKRVITYMHKPPVKKCPHCGNITPA